MENDAIRFTYRKTGYNLERSPHCFTLSTVVLNQKTGCEVLKPIGYYKDLVSVINTLFNLHVLNNTNAANLINSIKTTKEELKHIFDGFTPCKTYKEEETT